MTKMFANAQLNQTVFYFESFENPVKHYSAKLKAKEATK